MKLAGDGLATLPYRFAFSRLTLVRFVPLSVGPQRFALIRFVVVFGVSFENGGGGGGQFEPARFALVKSAP